MDTYDLVIVGGGITGPADAYVLCRYTNLRRIALIERRGGLAQVNSGHEGNAQSLHDGSIETNFSLAKALAVRDAAGLVASVLDRHPDEGVCVRSHKMVIGVGAAEVAFLSDRFREFALHFPELQFLDRDGIAQVEPKVVEGRDPSVPLAAIFSGNGYIVNYGRLAELLTREAKDGSAALDTFYRTEVLAIERTVDGFTVRTNRGAFATRAVLVSAGAHSIVFAKQLGYAPDLEVLPVAGSFYRTRIRRCLTGKVYTVQIPGIPFAAVHGDPEVTNPDETRFGPTAKMLPMLERHRYGTVLDFLRQIVWKPRGLLAYVAVLRDPTILAFALKNALVDLPVLGRWIFLRDVRKIVPTMRYADLTYATGVGGIRPQIVNTKTMALEMGEGRIVGDRVIFNVTPSPGASKCLAAAEHDAMTLTKFWASYQFDRERFRRDHAPAAHDSAPSVETAAS